MLGTKTTSKAPTNIDLSRDVSSEKTVAHSIKILQADNPYFVLMPGKHKSTRVAAGLTLSLIVAFTPEDLRDYKHELICVTDRELYSIPVDCIGPRAVLDIPDEITFDDTPIRHTSSKNLIVRNNGNATACVTMIVDAPFTILPAEWTVQPNGFIETTVTFCPHESGEYAERLHAVLATGEQLEIGMRGRGVIAPVRLDPAYVVVPDTYVGLSTVQTTRIINESSIPMIFTWSQCGERDEGSDVKPSDSVMSQMFVNTISFLYFQSFRRSRVCAELSRSFDTQIGTCQCCPLSLFQVDPVEGIVRPFSEKEITVAFCPQEGKAYDQTAYCDITGRTERLAMHVKGTGVGPKVQFSFACLDMGKIFIGSKHSYELVLANVGCIDAMFTIRTADKHFGTCFAFTPDDGLITPGGYQSIQITFCSPSLLGEFDAVFEFAFDGCPEPRPVRFRGAVVGPTFHTDVSEVDFGEISPGFSSEKWIKLKNTSLIPMEFALRVQKKASTLIGTDCRTCSSSESCANPGTHFEKDQTDNSVTTRRVRFTESNDLTVQPSAGLIDPVSSTNLMIFCSPTELGLQEYMVMIDVVGVGQAIEKIPVKTRCVCPSITISPKELNLRRCFLRHPYPVTFTLTNQSEHPASFQLTDLIASTNGKEETENENELEYCATQTEGKIDALGTVVLPITFKAKTLGRLERDVKINICGLEQNPLVAHVSCTGEGPVLFIEPTSLNWGTIPVLEASERTVKITNESAIPAAFTIRMVAPDSIFRAFPNAGVVPPLGRVDVTISAVPDDLITFKDQMEVTVSDTLAPRQVNLMASGQGCTFVSDPVIPETLHLGTQFSARPVHATFHLTNKGRRTQQLIWTIEGQFVRKSSQGSLKSEELESHWTFNPTRFELAPGGSRSITLEVICNRPMLAKRRIFCHHIIGRKGVKTLVKTVDVSVEFIAPLVHLSHQQLNYRVVKEPYDTLKTQLQTLNIKNDSGIPLTCRLEVSEPFYLVVDGAWISNQVLPLDANEMSDIQVLFDPTYKDDLHSRSIEKLLQITFAEHPSMNAVQLFGEVLFPNLIFDTEAVRFGYILNHTEITRHVLMTNPSPLPVRYRWTFLVGNEANIVFRRQTRIQEPYLSPLHSHRVIEGDASKDEAERPLEAKEEEELVDRSLQERNGVDSPSLRIDTNEANGNEQSGTPQNTILEVLLEQDHDVIPLGIEEIFDITPVFGELAPGATQSVSFVFYGHADIEASVRAICEVDGGPTYTMEVSGGASQIRYYLDRQVVEFEPARFDRTVTQELELSNTGQVDFGYAIGPTGITDSVLNVVPAQLKEYQVNTGQLTVEPATGYLASGETRFIRISYLARKPETFVKYLQLQVGHFEPQTIVVRGVADFPRVNLDLPRFYSIERSETLRLKRTNTKEEPNDIQELTVFESSMGNLLSALYGGVQELVYEWEKHTDVPLVCSCRASAMMQRSSTPEHHLTRRNDLDPIFCHGPKCFVSKAIQLVLHGPLSSPRNIPDWILQRIPDIPFQMEAERFHICDLLEQRTLTPDVWISVDAEENISTRPYRTSFDGLEISSSSKKLQLPSYLLDFGVVVFGTVARRVVRTINTGYEPVSFRFEPTSLKHAEHVGFTPSISRIRNLPGAPEHDWIEWEIAFDPKGANVPTGLVETKLMINILHGPLIPIHLRAQVVVPVIEAHLKNINFGHVQRGEARLMTVQLENPSPVTVNWSHFVSSPLNRRCIRPVDKHPAFNPPVFEVIPKQGKLEAGEKTNIQQDQILRSLGGYDTHGLLLLPPRKPGEGLPEELVSYYDQLMTKEMEKSRDGTDGPEDSDEDDDASFLRVDDERKLSRTTTSLTSAEIVATTFNSNFSGSQVEPIPPDLLPVSLAISRYLGVNQTSEALKKAQKAGIVIIVHGALAALRKPFIQKLVKEYQSTVLSVDQIVLEALATSFTEAANRARQLCMEAGRIHIKMEGVIPSGSCETGQKPSDNDDESAEHSMGKLERSSIQTSVVFQEQEASPQMASGPPSRRISLTGILPSGAPVIALSPSPFEGETNTLSPEELGSHFMYSTLLPDDLIICLIQERISAGDCHKGIIFDGLDCSFTKSRLETARLILKALQDRQYVYAVSAISEFSHFKALEEQVLATQTVMQMAREAARQKYADEITESEYNDLSEEERQEVNELRIRLRKEKRQVELEQQRLREEQERIEQEAELKRLELEHAHRRKGRRSLEKVSGLARPQTTTTTTTKLSESGDQKQPVSGSVMASLADSSQTERLQSQSESRHRVSHGSARQRQAVSEEPGSNESDRLLHQIFKAFNAEFPSICALFGKWDRVTSTEQQLTVSDDMYEGPSSLGVRRHRIEGSARGSSVGGPSKTRKSGQKRDSTEVKNVSPLLPVYCDQVDQTKLIAEQAVDSTPTDLMVPKETINVCPTLGVTHLVINAKPELISNILEDTRKEISPTAINAENPPPIRSTRSEALSVDDIFVKRFQQGESSEYPPFALLMQYLPPPEEIWDYLGLSKKMPTLEGPVDFSVVQYPPPRSLPVQPVSWLSRTPSESSGTRSTPTGRRAESSLLTYFQFYPSGCGDPVPVDQKAPEALRLPEETQIDEQSLKSPPQAGKKFRSPRVESGASSVATARKKSSPSRGRHRTGASSRDTTPTDITISLGEHASRTA
ncbi:hydrocephalus-inducing protein homolog, partial [Clonorchis sinensis]